MDLIFKVIVGKGIVLNFSPSLQDFQLENNGNGLLVSIEIMDNVIFALLSKGLRCFFGPLSSSDHEGEIREITFVNGNVKLDCLFPVSPRRQELLMQAGSYEI